MAASPDRSSPRRLVLVLGDQLTRNNPVFDAFDPALDRVLMIEAPGEATAVWSHKARIAIFLAAMRHFCNDLHRRGLPYTYLRLDEQPEAPSFAARLRDVLARHRPQSLVVCEPGEWRMLAAIQQAANEAGVPLQVLPDRHFLCSREEFERWAGNKRELRMEFFYREMRRRHQVLMDTDGREPIGGRWNFDAENRSGYPKSGPGAIPAPARFEPDPVTRQVITLVEQHFPDHPGSLDDFGWPVTREQALEALRRFVAERLDRFGPHQDAMWTDTPWGWHALLSSSLNLHLLDPREVIDAATAHWQAAKLDPDSDRGQVLLASIEGFIRQILGWREFIRGVYWLDMPGLAEANHYEHRRRLPAWYWTADTRMNCMREVIGQTLRHGFSHHIQRLMVTGQFALLAEVEPRQVTDWYLAIYVDAVEWVELPNTAGMALHADGGRFTSKPYIASGRYIDRMSNYCKGCRYRPELRTGEGACPVTTLYWNFLDRHEKALAANPRTRMMVRNIERLGADERVAIREHAAKVLSDLDAL